MPLNSTSAARAPLRKSERTRAKLVRCAVSVFSRRGVDSAAVSEITQEAGVANGTFYNHFRDKDEVVSAVVDYIMTSLFARIEEQFDEDWTGIECLSFTTREFIRLACEQEEWGFMMFRALASVPELRHSAAAYILPVLKSSVATGDLLVEADDFLGNMIVTMNMMTVFSCLHGDATPLEAGCRVAEYQLRMVGLPADRAAEIARAPLGFERAKGKPRARVSALT
jgi:AcrR family transcriptional regulator